MPAASGPPIRSSKSISASVEPAPRSASARCASRSRPDGGRQPRRAPVAGPGQRDHGGQSRRAAGAGQCDAVVAGRWCCWTTRRSTRTRSCATPACLPSGAAGVSDYAERHAVGVTRPMSRSPPGSPARAVFTGRDDLQSNSGVDGELDLATGGAGAETVITTLRFSSQDSASGFVSFLPLAAVYPSRPVPGSRSGCARAARRSRPGPWRWATTQARVCSHRPLSPPRRPTSGGRCDDPGRHAVGYGRARGDGPAAARRELR